MQSADKVYNFFLSAITPNGFTSKFSELCNYEKFNNVYMIKGPSGSGKSTFIKNAVNNKGIGEAIHCSLDVSSLDGAVFYDSKTAILDATPPHSCEPKMPCGFEKMISLYDFFDSNIIESDKEKLKSLLKASDSYMLRAKNYIKAAGMLISNSEYLTSGCINTEKLSNYITRLCKREFKRTDNKGEERIRYLSTLSGDGVFMFSNTASKMCDKIYIIDDDSSAVSSLIMLSVRHAALSCGYTVYTCLCPMSMTNKIDHVFVPELSLGFMSANKFHMPNIENAKIIRAKRFIDNECIKRFSVRNRYSIKASKELLSEAAANLKKAVSTHLEKEKLYIDACNFKARNAYLNKYLTEINSLPS